MSANQVFNFRQGRVTLSTDRISYKGEVFFFSLDASVKLVAVAAGAKIDWLDVRACCERNNIV